jgi:hypothetical protein
MATEEKESKVLIENGPNIWSLIIDSLTYQKPVTFLIKPLPNSEEPLSIKVIVNSVFNHSNNTSDPSEWGIHGVVIFRVDQIDEYNALCSKLHLRSPKEDELLYFYGCYSTEGRSGRLSLTFEWQNKMP